MAKARDLFGQESDRLLRRRAPRARGDGDSSAFPRGIGQTDLDADRYRARFHRVKSEAAAGYDGDILPARRPRRSAHLLLQGFARVPHMYGSLTGIVPHERAACPRDTLIREGELSAR